MEPPKENFIYLLQLLASTSEQDQYQSEVVPTDIAEELTCMWFDDFYSPDQRQRMMPLLSSEEQKRIDEFHGFYNERVDLLPNTYAQLRESDVWREVVRKAGETLVTLEWDKVRTTPNFGAM